MEHEDPGETLESVTSPWRASGRTGPKPWKLDTRKVSTDPHFEEKLVDVVGIYTNPPKRAVVFSFDENTQCRRSTEPHPCCP